MATIIGFFWEPRVPKSSLVLKIILILCSCVTSATTGYDGSMMNGLNILPAYLNYFSIDTPMMSLSTSAIYIGGIMAGITYPHVLDKLGRRAAMFWAALLTIVFVILQTAAVNLPMFIVARIFIGYANAASTVAVPTYLAETLPYDARGWGLGLLTDFYYVGALIAAGVTYGTSQMDSTWSWRLPSVFQAIFSVLCIIVLPFLPESPRWLIHGGRLDEARVVLAQTCANGDIESPIVLVQYKEIVDTIQYEKDVGETLSVMQIIKTPVARKRVLLAISSGLATVIVGNQIASYYLGTMLSNAGIQDPTTQLQINIILNAFCLVCALVGTVFADKIGRRLNALVSTILLTIFLFIVGALTKIYGGSDNTSAVYGTVAAIFLFMGSYSFGWTPLAFLYPPEVLNYPIRANGMGVNTFFIYASGLLTVFTLPYALNDLGWKTYMMNGSWNVLLIAFIYFYWVETKGKTLEEIDAEFDGVKHSDVPDVREIEAGKADLKQSTVENVSETQT